MLPGPAPPGGEKKKKELHTHEPGRALPWLTRRCHPTPNHQSFLGVLFLLLPRSAGGGAFIRRPFAPVPPAPSARGGEIAKALWHASAAVSAFVRTSAFIA